MTFLVSSDPLISGGFAVRAYPGFGILGADIPDDGDNGSSPVINDTGVVSDGEYYWFAETFPSSGTLTLYPDLTFMFEGAADGAYTWTYRVGDHTGESATVGTVTLTIGSVDGVAVGNIAAITLASPSASAIGTVIVSGLASGVLPRISISSVQASAVGTTVVNGAGIGSLPVVNLLTPNAVAYGNALGDGFALVSSIVSVDFIAPSGYSIGTILYLRPIDSYYQQLQINSGYNTINIDSDYRP